MQQDNRTGIKKMETDEKQRPGSTGGRSFQYQAFVLQGSFTQHLKNHTGAGEMEDGGQRTKCEGAGLFEAGVADHSQGRGTRPPEQPEREDAEAQAHDSQHHYP